MCREVQERGKREKRRVDILFPQCILPICHPPLSCVGCERQILTSFFSLSFLHLLPSCTRTYLKGIGGAQINLPLYSSRRRGEGGGGRQERDQFSGRRKKGNVIASQIPLDPFPLPPSLLSTNRPTSSTNSQSSPSVSKQYPFNKQQVRNEEGEKEEVAAAATSQQYDLPSPH